MKIELGIMQGRLSDKPGQSLQSFPYLTWKDEFFLARNFGLDHIEYLVDDVYDTLNPITNKEGRNQIAQLSKESNIKVNSLCAHTFISDNFLDPSNNSNIIFHGKKPRLDMGSYYKASDFLIISLIDDPIFSVTVPAKTQTYIAAKKPILAIINGETADIIRENNLGLCVDPSNVELICTSFQDCIDMTEVERISFVKNNEEVLDTIFNKENIINDLTKILVQQ